MAASLVSAVTEQVSNLSVQLQNLKNVLEDAERKRFVDKSAREWLVELEDVSYEMEDVLDEWQTALHKFQFQQSSCSFLPCVCFKKVSFRHDIGLKIENAKARLELVLLRSFPSTTTSERVQSTSMVDVADVRGRDTEKEVVGSSIFERTEGLEVLSIIGVGGIGKTTLAQILFNDTRVEDCFELKMWISVSDPFDPVEIAKKIIESVEPKKKHSHYDQFEVLLKELKRCISGKKFFLVLDNVWNVDRTKWEPLKIALKSGGGNGSKILVTTRNENVAKTFDTLVKGIHRLEMLSDESCWLILKRIALFGRDEEDCAKYKDVGMKIVDKCKGLPLAAKALGSLLCCKNGLEEWENLSRSEIWDLEETRVEIFPHLLLSYNELSPELKRCFSYCAVFPKDSLIRVGILIRHWMAQGYLGSDIESGGGDMELRGQHYFDILAMSSLFQDFVKDNDGEKILAFKLHHIVHDFARFLRKNGTSGGRSKRRCDCNPEFVSQVKQFRDLSREGLPICRECLISTSVRVLKFKGYSGIDQLGIDKLVHLRWLDLTGTNLSQGNGLYSLCLELFNLQTFVLRQCQLEKIPREVGNLVRLRHLDLSHNLLKELPREIGKLIHLEHLNLSLNFLKKLPREVGNLINIRVLDLTMNLSLEELPL